MDERTVFCVGGGNNRDKYERLPKAGLPTNMVTVMKEADGGLARLAKLRAAGHRVKGKGLPGSSHISRR